MNLKGDKFWFDTETTGLSPWQGDRPFAFSFCDEDENVFYVEFPVDPFTREVQVDLDSAEQIVALLERNCYKGGWNVKFDVRMAEALLGVNAAATGRVGDAMFKAHVCRSTEFNFGLKELAKKYRVVENNNDEKELHQAVVACRRYAKKQDWKIAEDVEADYWLPAAVARHSPEMLQRYPDLPNVCKRYAILDAIRTKRLDQFYDAVMDHENVQGVYSREMKLWPYVYEMETHGIRMDRATAQAEADLCTRTLTRLRSSLSDVFGEFGAEVPRDRIRTYLFSSRSVGGLGLTPDPHKLTKEKKQPQVTKDVLEGLENDVPIVRTVREFGKHRTALSTYFNNYIDAAVPSNGQTEDDKDEYHVLHPNYEQIGPKSGRFSSRNPPLQNVPKRAKEGDILKRVRRPFGPRPGKVWLHMDYKSIEARIFAEEADEETMIDLFQAGQDVYDYLVDKICEITGTDRALLERKYDAEGGARQVCKNNHLGWQYGEGFDKLARQMRLSGPFARMVIKALKKAFTKAEPFMRRLQALGKKQGYIRNRFGRKIPVDPPHLNKEEKVVDFSYRVMAHLISSTAADILKTAMTRLGQYLQGMRAGGVDIWMVMTIHDELVFEIDKQELTPFIVGQLSKIMSKAAEEKFNRVKFPVDVNVTRVSWDTPEKLVFN